MALLAAARSGDKRAMEDMIKNNEGLIYEKLSRQGIKRTTPDFDDHAQEGRVKLWQAIEKYDPKTGFKFSTCAWEPIENALKDSIEKFSRWTAKTVPYALIDTYESAPDFTDAVIDRLDQEDALNQLPDVPRKVIKLHLFECMKQKDIAEILDLSNATVCRMKKYGLAALKNYLSVVV